MSTLHTDAPARRRSATPASPTGTSQGRKPGTIGQPQVETASAAKGVDPGTRFTPASADDFFLYGPENFEDGMSGPGRSYSRSNRRRQAPSVLGSVLISPSPLREMAGKGGKWRDSPKRPIHSNPLRVVVLLFGVLSYPCLNRLYVNLPQQVQHRIGQLPEHVPIGNRDVDMKESLFVPNGSVAVAGRVGSKRNRHLPFDSVLLPRFERGRDRFAIESRNATQNALSAGKIGALARNLERVSWALIRNCDFRTSGFSVGSRPLVFPLLRRDHSVDGEIRPLLLLHFLGKFSGNVGGIGSAFRLVALVSDGERSKQYKPSPDSFWPSDEAIPYWLRALGILYIGLGCLFIRFNGGCAVTRLAGCALGLLGGFMILYGNNYAESYDDQKQRDIGPNFHSKNVPQKPVTISPYCTTFITVRLGDGERTQHG